MAETSDGRETLAQINHLKPGLVFLDVQMPELDGFEVLQGLSPDVAPQVIFATAYDAFALRAFEAHAVDYLLKPFTRVRFRDAVEHALKRIATGPAGTLDSATQALLQTASQRRADRIPIRTDQGIYFVRVEEIDWIEADANYLRLHTGVQSHCLRETLKVFEQRLDPSRFLRVHRSAIVNLDSIQRLEPWFHGEYVVTLRDGTKLTSSRTYSARLRQFLR